MYVCMSVFSFRMQHSLQLFWGPLCGVCACDALLSWLCIPEKGEYKNFSKLNTHLQFTNNNSYLGDPTVRCSSALSFVV